MSQPLTLRTEAGDEHLDLGDFEARVRRGEISPQSLVRLPAVTGGDFVPACELQLYQSLHEPKRAYFARAFSVTRFPFMTSGLILFNLAAFLYTAQEGPLGFDEMVRFGGKVGPLVLDLGELWRLFTANFLHRDALHIGLNMFVLFNVGGALENTYRTLDYLWLLVFSGIVTMSTSLLLTDAVSIGASGMVYGCLGGMLVFLGRYWSLLPGRYKRAGQAMIPTVLGLFLIGVTSRGVDNWAHFGGLAAGMVCALFMRPRLLTDVERKWWSPALRAVPSLGVLALVFFGQQVFGGNLPRFTTERDDTFGIAVPVPRGWLKGANPLGSLAWYNGLPGLGRASFAAEAVQVGEGIDVPDAAEWARRFVDERLEPAALGPEVLKVTAEPPVPGRIGDRDALRVRARFDEPSGSTVLEAWFVPRGELLYQLVFTWPSAFPRYAQVADQMAQGIHFEEPSSLRQARAQAMLFPNSPESMARLGEALRREGEGLAAADVLQVAVRRRPADARFRRELSLSLLQAGEVERACESSAAAVLYAPNDVLSLEADARCRLAKGEVQSALDTLTAARALAPANERLKAAEAKLKQVLSRQ